MHKKTLVPDLQEAEDFFSFFRVFLKKTVIFAIFAVFFLHNDANESNQNTVTMVDLVLNDLRRPSCIYFGIGFHIGGLILHLNGGISFALARSAEERETSLLRIVESRFSDNYRV